VRALTLFATHYFELTALPREFPGIANLHLSAVEHAERIVFLHSVRDGPANQSYGLQVAALAGVPASVIARARERLRALEEDAAEQRAAGDSTTGPTQLSLFAPPAPHPALSALEAMNPDELTPRAALDALYRLKRLL
jgi:DNA mismatch repair protein MutS